MTTPTPTAPLLSLPTPSNHLHSPRGMLPSDDDLSAITLRLLSSRPSPTFHPSNPPPTLSPLELTLLHILPASNTILSLLSPVHLCLLAASSKTLWMIVFSHPHLWRVFNLRIHTRESLATHPSVLLADSGWLASRKSPAQILHAFSVVLKELQEYRLPWSIREYDGTTGDQSYGFRVDHPPGHPSPAGVAALLLSRIRDQHAFPKSMTVENYWLANTSITSSLRRFILPDGGGLRSLEVNLLMERDLVGMFRRDFSTARPGTLQRSFALLRTFLERVQPVGLERLIITGSGQYLLPSEHIAKLFHKTIVQVADILYIIDWCADHNVNCNLARCGCSNPDDERKVREIYEELKTNDAYPRPIRFTYPRFGFGEVRWCDACGQDEEEFLCTGCYLARECATCKRAKCKACFDEFNAQMTTSVWDRRKHRDLNGEGGDDYDVNGPPQPHTVRPFADDRGGIVTCPVCHIPRPPLIERKVCGRCGRLVQDASFSYVYAEECSTCDEILCASCVYVTSELRARDCERCEEMDCGGHEWVQCVSCEEGLMCPRCLNDAEISGPPRAPRHGTCRECDQWMCLECDDPDYPYFEDSAGTEASSSSAVPAKESDICRLCKRKTDWFMSWDTLDLGEMGASEHRDVLSKGRIEDDHEGEDEDELSEAGSSEGSQWGVGEEDWVDDLGLFKEPEKSSDCPMASPLTGLSLGVGGPTRG